MSNRLSPDELFEGVRLNDERLAVGQHVTHYGSRLEYVVTSIERQTHDWYDEWVYGVTLADGTQERPGIAKGRYLSPVRP